MRPLFRGRLLRVLAVSACAAVKTRLVFGDALEIAAVFQRQMRSGVVIDELLGGHSGAFQP